VISLTAGPAASTFELPKASVILSCLGWTVVSLSNGPGSMSKILTDLAGDEIAPSSLSVAVERAVGGDEGALSPRRPADIDRWLSLSRAVARTEQTTSGEVS